ncbi:RsfA family transcriptional regulator [Domibacillus aminovorans]|uniref:Transcriptional regulator n=1 Tax=Domibacillus aminovorans TaxID=29332 RepID=A0A177LAZ3_9BACI|nr:RsfA family transcriptional regulator [Domibacillus aminovorans]OAH62355.1 transcriptional regulator [Domibacillus aminovorans]
MKQRQDAWSKEDDLLLAETVLRHVREGSTQLNAFEEVGDQLNRTSAACGFRWNAVVRQQYEKALDLAKKQRKQRNRLLKTEQKKEKEELYKIPELTETVTAQSIRLHQDQTPLTIDEVISFLRSMDATYDIKKENDKLRSELEAVKNEKIVLEKKLCHLEKSALTMQEDYETMMKIMNRARKLVVLDEDDSSRATFKMESNGNLEKIAE